MAEVRALLFTDVVDSTELTRALGDAKMAELWGRHDRVARDLLAAHGGREIDKSDGFLLLFDDAASACDYARAYHRAVVPLGLKARAGLHFGPVILTQNSASDIARGAKPLEVDGLGKATAARVMAVALGGQTLLTADAATALPPAGNNADLRSGPPLVSHGHWMFKGLAEPIELFELGNDGDAPMRPPLDAPKAWRVIRQDEIWIPVREIRHGLPRERDPFVGRAADFDALAQLLDGGAALVSVLGIGGTGKTRFVTRFAWTWLGAWPGGAWFCDLSEARSVEGIASAVARALDVRLAKDDPLTQLGQAIAGRGRCLVILDNFEQVARYAPETLGQWLDRAHEAQFIVTTREVLGIPGETALALAPLAEDEAAELFVTRAAQAKRDFRLTANDRSHVLALVKLLDGLPLAIELAAARVRVMSPQVLLDRMSERFELLMSARGRHTRQATLRATLDWSWELLSPDERLALQQLSVFEGGFTLEAAEAVLALSGDPPTDAVQALVDKSLVRHAGSDRLDLFVSVQEYAAEKLLQSGGRDVTESRHGAHYARYGEDAALDALDTWGGEERRRALGAEIDNVVAACRRAISRRDGRMATHALRAAWTVLHQTGPLGVGAELAEHVLALDTPDTTLRTQALMVLGTSVWSQGRVPESLVHYEAMLQLAEESGDVRAQATAHRCAGQAHRLQGRFDEAVARMETAIALAKSVGDRRNEGFARENLAIVHLVRGNPDETKAEADAAFEIYRAVGDRRSEGRLSNTVGISWLEQGRHEEARACFDLALEVFRESGDRYSEGLVLVHLGNLLQDQGHLDLARANYDRAGAIARDVGSRRFEALVDENLGTLDLTQGRVDDAEAHFRRALPYYREVGDRLFVAAVTYDLAVVCARRDHVDEARAHFDEALRGIREVGDPGTEGHMLVDLGRLELEQGRLEAARACFDSAEALLRRVRDRVWLGRLLTARALLESALGRAEAARGVFAEAEALASQIGAGPESELGLGLARARLVLDALGLRQPVDHA